MHIINSRLNSELVDQFNKKVLMYKDRLMFNKSTKKWILKDLQRLMIVIVLISITQIKRYMLAAFMSGWPSNGSSLKASKIHLHQYRVRLSFSIVSLPGVFFPFSRFLFIQLIYLCRRVCFPTDPNCPQGDHGQKDRSGLAGWVGIVVISTT